jgi:hypothetical protein
MAYDTMTFPRTARQVMGGPYGALWLVVAVMGALVLAAAIYGLVRSQLDARAERDAVPVQVVRDPNGAERPFGRPNRGP